MKPMLACNAPKNIEFPVYASPKLDGVRCVIVNGEVKSRSLKNIPNKFVQELFGKSQFDGFDGELIVGPSTAKDVFQKTSSGVMSIEGEPDVIFYVFDNFEIPKPFTLRYSNMSMYLRQLKHKNIKLVEQVEISNQDELNAYEQKQLELGYEGVMIRNKQGAYKHGRSTIREAYLMKVKRFEDSEARIIAFYPKMHNTNEQTINELGTKVRSSKKAGKKELNTLGSITVIDLKTNIEFDIGSGFDDEMRKYIWENQSKLRGEIVKYKHQPTGAKDKPRFPIFLGFRNEIDL